MKRIVEPTVPVIVWFLFPTKFNVPVLFVPVVTFCEFTVPLNVDVVPVTPEFTSFNAFPTPTVPVIVELPFNVNVPVLFVPVVVIEEEFKPE